MTALVQQILPDLPVNAKRWWVAVSSGMDSMCLLHLLEQLQQSSLTNPALHIPPIAVIHVNHGLQACASSWERMVQQQAATYGFVFQTVKIDINATDKAAHGTQAAARQARYAAFEQHLKTEEVLLLAHHADDQAETVLLRLLRGAGVAGLAAMPRQRPLGQGSLYRPLLFLTRAQLQAHASEHQLRWSHDPSNDNCHYDRNYLRHTIMPMLQQRWPQVVKRLQTTAKVMQASEILLQHQAQSDTLTLQSADASLTVAGLMQLSTARRHNVLRGWLAQQNEASPSYEQMQRIEEEVLMAQTDARPILKLSKGTIRRSQGTLFWLAAKATSWQEKTWYWSAAPCGLSLVGGYMVKQINGLSLRDGDKVQIRRRQGGERCRPLGRVHSQSLKKLLQATKIPHWQRDDLPLFYVNGELAMVAHLWICEDFQTLPGKMGWIWQKM